MARFHSCISLFISLHLAMACTHASHKKSAVSADDDVVASLKAGSKRFASEQALRPHQDQDRVQTLSSQQAPEAVIVSCSDSRVPPEIVFDQGLGNIFSVRTAGHVLDAYSIASIEFAVENLGSKVIIVMGHSSCGAVKAAINTPVGQSTGFKNIDQLVAQIRPGLKTVDPADKELIAAGKNNVEAAIRYLKQNSPLIREEFAQNKVKIVPALYFLSTGRVEFW